MHGLQHYDWPAQAPVLLRLAFHDAATYELAPRDGGANASVQFELSRPENTGLRRGWYVCLWTVVSL